MSNEGKREKEIRTLPELRAEAASLKEVVTKLDKELSEKQIKRAAANKEFHRVIGKIETRVASGEV